MSNNKRGESIAIGDNATVNHAIVNNNILYPPTDLDSIIEPHSSVSNSCIISFEMHDTQYDLLIHEFGTGIENTVGRNDKET